MKHLYKARQKSWEDVPDPVIQKSTDIIVKNVATTICGTDLHILKATYPRLKLAEFWTRRNRRNHRGRLCSRNWPLVTSDPVLVSRAVAVQTVAKGCFALSRPRRRGGIGWIFAT